MSPRDRMYLWGGAIMAMSWLSLTVVHPRGAVSIGYFLGTLSAQVTLAAAWLVFGPTRLWPRLLVSLGWCGSLLLAVGINMSFHSGPHDVLLVVGVLLLSQWLLLQLPLWSLALGLKLHLRHRDDADPEASAIELRFSVRHLFLIMSIAGLLLGIGRVVVPMIHISGGHELPIFVFLAVAGVVMTFPLLVATLMRRMALPGAVLSLMFIGAATVAELPLFLQIGGNGPGADDFIAINTFSALLVLAVAAAVRLNGFSLHRKLKAM